ncbi:hypothetical protein AAMO2058_000731800 [Amorphochlora amoebiformis]
MVTSTGLLLGFMVPLSIVAVDMQHSFQPPFHPNGVPFWRHGAGAFINESFIRLTPARQSRTGYFWNNLMSKMTAWEVEFDFKITGDKLLGGDGFAFWYVETPEVLGMVYGSADYWTGLGVFFDTYDNNAAGQTPLITAVINDGTLKYDSGADGEYQAVGKCSYRIRNLDNPSRVKIKYSDQTLSVSIATDRSGSYEPCFHVPNIMLGTDKFFGLSAHTGDVADSHDIYQFSATDLTPKEEDIDEIRSKYHDYVEKRADEHETMSQNEFMHRTLSLLRQIQESITMVEESAIEAVRRGFEEGQDEAGRATGGNLRELKRDMNRLLNSIREVQERVDSQSVHAPVDRDFITREMKAIKGEIISLKGGSGSIGGSTASERKLKEIIAEQMSIKMSLARIERSISGGSSSSTAPKGGYSSMSGGWSIGTVFKYLMYLLFVFLLLGLLKFGYDKYQSRQRRSYKLL